jgi:hypothetical protein
MILTPFAAVQCGGTCPPEALPRGDHGGPARSCATCSGRSRPKGSLNTLGLNLRQIIMEAGENVGNVGIDKDGNRINAGTYTAAQLRFDLGGWLSLLKRWGP